MSKAMKKVVLLFLTGALSVVMTAGTVWAEFGFFRAYQAVSTGNFVSTGMAVHQETGDLLISGYYSGKTILGGASLDSGGGSQAFLARLDSAGVPRWIREVRGSGNKRANGVAVDGAGNSYVTGESIGAATIQEGSTGTVSLAAAGDRFMFVAKYDPTGNLLWVRRGTSSYELAGDGMAVDVSGNVYVAGWFWNDASFDGSNVTGSGFSPSNIYVAHYGSDGSIQRVVTMTTATWCRVNGIAVTGAGAITLVGEFSGVAFGLSSAGNRDAFVARYDGAGTFQWARGGIGAGTNLAQGVAADGSGGVVVVGQVSGTASFGAKQVVSTGGYDGFVARYDSSGNVSWVTGFGGAGDDAAGGVSISPSGRIAVAGEISGTVILDGKVFTSRGGSDAFTGIYSPSGDFISGFAGGGSGDDFAKTAAWKGDELLAVAGGFTGAAGFGAVNLGTHAALSGKADDLEGEGGELFLALLSDELPAGGIPGDFTGNGRVGLEDVIAILQFLTFQR